jgi:hypothetical protein
MNITVIIPKALQSVCEGRSKIELGVPPASNVGEVIQTLVALYPGLKGWIASEARAGQKHFGVAQAGRKVFLFTSQHA